MRTRAGERTLLYFGDLAKSVDKDFLTTLITNAGVQNVQNIVIRDAKYGNYKFAFVTLATEDDSKKVIEELNYTKLDGIPIRICYADPETHRIMRMGTGNLFIKNLDPQIEVSQLHEAFQAFGEIISCRIPFTNGKSRGYGFVQFRKVEDADRAMADLKDASIYGKTIVIEKYIRKQPKNPEETYTNIYVKNLPESIDSDEKLGKFLGEFGEYISCKLNMKDDKPSGFGYCNFARHEDAKACVEKLNGLEMEGNVLYASRMMSREERKNTLERLTRKYKTEMAEKTKYRNLYVRGFPEEYTDEDLRKYFEEYGEVESAKVMREAPKEDAPENELPPSRKFGFVCFKTREDAKKAIQQSAINKENPLFVSYAQPKDVRMRVLAKQLEAKNAGRDVGASGAVLTTGIQQMSDREMLIREIAEEPSGEQLQKELRNISDEQAKCLVENHEAYKKWVENRILHPGV